MHARLTSALSRRLGRRDAESGVVLVEFAFILPVFLLMIFLVIDFGRAINYWIDETHLASEGARLAAVNQVPSGGDLKTYLRGEADSNELRNGGTDSVSDPLQVCVDFPPNAVTGTSGKVGDPVKVTVRTTYSWMPLLGTATPSSTIVGSATQRLERTPSYSAGCTS